MKTFNTTVRCFVYAFVFVAGHLTFAGLDPKAKAEAESAFDPPEQNTQEKNVATAKKPIVPINAETTG